MKEFKMYIGGKWVDASSGETFDSKEPFSGKVYAKIPKAGPADVEKVMAAAYAARKEWAATQPLVRRQMLLKVAQLLESKRMDFVEAMALESGATFGKGMFELDCTIDLLLTAAADSKLLQGETFHTDNDRFSMSVRKPRGTIVSISPWNFPMVLSMYKIAYGLAMGNTVVHKPSSDTPVLALMTAQLYDEAGFPPGALGVITGPGGLLGDLLVADKRCSYVAVTGSTATGRHVAVEAAKHFKECYLELGGKNPLVVLADANMEYAVKTAAFNAFLHQGEICVSTDRVIVEEKIAEEFSQKLAKLASGLPKGDPTDQNVFIGPVINDTQVKSIHELVTDAQSKGAKLLTGGKYEGRVYEPTVLYGIKPDMRIYYEETFGPVAPVIIVKDEKEALAVANDTQYGLSSSVITSDYEKAMFFADNLEAGMVHINSGSVDADSVVPFGGWKESGIGREGGRYSQEAFTEVQWLTFQKNKKQYPF